MAQAPVKEVEEQAVEPTLEQEPAEPVEQPDTAETDEPEATETKEAEEPETPDEDTEPAPLDLTTDDGIAAALETNPQLKAFIDHNVANAKNEGAQTEKTRLEVEAGSREQTQLAVRQVLAAFDSEANPDEIIAKAGEREVTKIGLLYELATSNASVKLAKAMPDALMSNFDISVEVREEAMGLREQGQFDGYVTTLINGAVASEVEKATEKIKEDERKSYDKRLVGEIEARKLEANPAKEPAPAIPGGSPGGSGITPTQWHDADFAQRAEWKKQGIDPEL